MEEANSDSSHTRMIQEWLAPLNPKLAVIQINFSRLDLHYVQFYINDNPKIS